MNSSPSAWPWALQHITVRSSTPLQGARGQAPWPACRAKPQGDRTHLTQGNGWSLFEEVSEPQAGIRRHTGSATSWCSTPWCCRWWNSWLKSFRCLRLLWSTSHPRQQCYLQRQWWSSLPPRQLCPNRRRQMWSTSHPHQRFFFLCELRSMFHASAPVVEYLSLALAVSSSSVPVVGDFSSAPAVPVESSMPCVKHDIDVEEEYTYRGVVFFLWVL